MTPSVSGQSHHLASMDDPIWDLVVIGAGPAGGMTSYLAAKSGLRTLLIERHAFPRNKVCGGCLNSAGVDLLNRVGLGEIPRRFGLVVDQFYLGLKHRRFQIPLPAGVAIARTDLDSELVQAAMEQGAHFLSETTAHVGALRSDHREIRLVSHGLSRVVRASSVVIASGLKGAGGIETHGESLFRTRVSHGSRIGAGCTLPGEMSEYPAGRISMAIGRKGYVGLTPTRQGLGIASAFDSQFLKTHQGPAAAAVEILHEAGFAVPIGIHDVPWSGTLPLTRQTRPVAANRIFLVGDAAGYVEPFTGQGMAIAIQAAAELTPILKNAAHQPVGICEREWTKYYTRHISNRHFPASLTARLLRRPMVASLAFGLVSCVPRTSNYMIQSINRTIEIPSAH